MVDPGSQPPGSCCYLPFKVPDAAGRIAVSYHYENSGQATEIPEPPPSTERPDHNVLDIAIFDSGGIDPITGGFRGYSGSARQSFFIARHDATPGYLPGDLQPGDWNLMLGVASLLPEGARWWASVEIDVETAPLTPMHGVSFVPSDSVPLGQRDGRWVPGDLHSHTEHSDGANSVAELAQYAYEVGLRYLAVTDHNTTSHHQDVADNSWTELLLLPGEEVTTYYGHANVWGLREWVDFRCQDDEGLRQIVDFVHERGKLFSINHPKRGGPDWRFENTVFDCLEVWQAPWRWRNEESLALWSTMLRAGHKVVGVGGSDIHAVPPAPLLVPGHRPGNPCTWLWIEGDLTEEKILEAIRAGHAFISESPAGPTLDIRVGDALPGDTATVDEGRLQVRVKGSGLEGRTLRLLCNEDEVWRRRYEDEATDELVEIVAERDGPLRAELRGLRGRPERGEVVWALTNPIYLQVRKE
jgi:PHP domain